MVGISFDIRASRPPRVLAVTSSAGVGPLLVFRWGHWVGGQERTNKTKGNFIRKGKKSTCVGCFLIDSCRAKLTPHRYMAGGAPERSASRGSARCGGGLLEIVLFEKKGLQQHGHNILLNQKLKGYRI